VGIFDGMISSLVGSGDRSPELLGREGTFVLSTAEYRASCIEDAAYVASIAATAQIETDSPTDLFAKFALEAAGDRSETPIDTHPDNIVPIEAARAALYAAQDEAA
jgi:hypothetical protein